MPYKYKRRVHALVDLDEVAPGLLICPECTPSQDRLQQTIEKLESAITDYGRCAYIMGSNDADGTGVSKKLRESSDKKFKKIFKVLGLKAPERK